MTAAARWVATGFALARPETQAARRAICDPCPELDTRLDRCRSCGCWLKAKLRLPGEFCPLAKWGVEDDGVEAKPGP